MSNAALRRLGGILAWIVLLGSLGGQATFSMAAPLAAPSISLSPSRGPAGSVVEILGSGFTPGGYPASLLWDGVVQTTFFVPQGGTFQLQYTIPAETTAGDHVVTVCAFCGQGEFEQRASAKFTVTVSEKSPQILSLTLDQDSIHYGQCTYLRWTTANAYSATLKGDFGTLSVNPNGSLQVCPAATQVYRLTVVGSPNAKPNTASAKITLLVIPLPTNTPLPTATATSLPTATAPPTPTLITTPTGGLCSIPPGATLVTFDEIGIGELRERYLSGQPGYAVDWPAGLYTVGSWDVNPRSPPLAVEVNPVRTGTAVTLGPRFHGGWSHAGLFIVRRSRYDRGSVTVTLRAFDAGGAVVDSDSVTLAEGEVPPDTCLQVSAADIRRLELTAQTESGTATYFIFDDFFFIESTLPECTGEVVILSPVEGADLGWVDRYTVRGEFSLSERLPNLIVTTPRREVRWSDTEGSSSADLEVSPIPGRPNHYAFTLTERVASAGEQRVEAFIASPLCAGWTVARASRRFFVTAEVDVEVQAVEVTQGIRGDIPSRPFDSSTQLLRDSAVHVANRRTVVRVYPWLRSTRGIAGWAQLEARLRGFRGGAELPGSPLLPVNNPLRFTGEASLWEMRAASWHSWNFVLPSSWTEVGAIEIEIEVGVSASDRFHRECATCRADNITRLSGVRFVQVQRQPITVVMYLADLYWLSPSSRVEHAVPYREIPQALDYWYKVWPMADGMMQVDFIGVRLTRRVCRESFSRGRRLEVCRPEVFGVPVWDNEVFMREQAALIPPCCRTDPYAYIPLVFSPLSPIGCSGLAGIGWPPLFQGGACGKTIAHEAAHYLGRLHASNAHGEARGGGVDPGFPHPHGEIETNAVAFDVLTLRPWGSRAHDYMSYGPPPYWTSIYTWQAIARAFDQPEIRALAPPGDTPMRIRFHTLSASYTVEAAPEEGVLFSGEINPDGQLTFLGPAFRDQLNLSPQGEARAELHAADGQVLASRDVETWPLSDVEEGTLGFRVLLPELANAASVVFFRGEEMLGGLPISPNPPSVRWLIPNGSAHWGATGEITLQWDAHDPDGDPLFFRVQMILEGGGQRKVLASTVQGHRLTLDLADLPISGSAWRLQVQASDGYRTAIAETGPITLDPKPPRPFIFQPPEGAVFSPGQAITLQGQATEDMGQFLPAEALEWFVDGSSVGKGRMLTIGGLELGEHIITLRAISPNGLSSETSVKVLVPLDADGDRLSDEWETAHGLNPEDPSDGENDPDSDGLPNWQEWYHATSPNAADSDGDGIADFDEVEGFSDPADANSKPFYLPGRDREAETSLLPNLKVVASESTLSPQPCSPSKMTFGVELSASETALSEVTVVYGPEAQPWWLGQVHLSQTAPTRFEGAFDLTQGALPGTWYYQAVARDSQGGEHRTAPAAFRVVACQARPPMLGWAFAALFAALCSAVGLISVFLLARVLLRRPPHRRRH